MAAKNNRQKLTDDCPKQEADIQDSCGPCGATDCDTEDDAGCATCE